MPMQSQRLPWIIAGAAGVGLFVAFAVWGGIPADVSAGAFWAQSAIFLLVICAFVIAFWHLLIRPLAPSLRQPQKQALTFRARELLALILAFGGFATVVGGLWDEVWHRSYGIPFGEDLLWRPHLLIYFGFATFSACGFWALLYLNRHLPGNFQQRFRANTMVGLLIMNAAFLLYALPADPVWHLIFGEDITPWSAPHLILLISFVVTQLLALDLHVSTWKRHEWHVIFKLRLDDSLSLLILAALQMLWLQLMLIDWDAAIIGLMVSPSDMYRPEWLLAANLTACVAFVGVVATRVTRCAGAATAAGLLALVIRLILIRLFDAEMLQVAAWLAALLPLIAIDIWAYYSSAIRKREPSWRGTAIAVIAAMVLNAPLMRSLYQLPNTDDLAYAAAIIATAGGMSWFANQLADAMLRQHEATVSATSERQSIKPIISFGILAAFLGFIVVFIATAAPPI